jgi:hypothetical protein
MKSHQSSFLHFKAAIIAPNQLISNFTGDYLRAKFRF